MVYGRTTWSCILIGHYGDCGGALEEVVGVARGVDQSIGALDRGVPMMLHVKFKKW